MVREMLDGTFINQLKTHIILCKVIRGFKSGVVPPINIRISILLVTESRVKATRRGSGAKRKFTVYRSASSHTQL